MTSLAHKTPSPKHYAYNFGNNLRLREILADSCVPIDPQYASRPTVVLDVLQNPDTHFLYTGAAVKGIVYDQLKARLKEVSIRYQQVQPSTDSDQTVQNCYFSTIKHRSLSLIPGIRIWPCIVARIVVEGVGYGWCLW